LGLKEVLFKGKTLLIIGVLIAAAIAGVLAFNSFYTWTKKYTIKPLTSFETLVLPPTTGATMGYVINYTDERSNPIEAVTPVIVYPIARPPIFLPQPERPPPLSIITDPPPIILQGL
jgi:hypothetical protein